MSLATDRRRLHPAELRGPGARQRLRDGRRRAGSPLDSPRAAAPSPPTTPRRRTRRPGTQDVDTTRATYFAGRSPMIVWSSFLLDELAGLRDDAVPSWPECLEDPRFLADNSGIVTALNGPDGASPPSSARSLLGGDRRPRPRPAARFVAYMMCDGYRSGSAMAPEGKFPVRARARRRSRQRFLERVARQPASASTPGGSRWIDLLRRCSTSWPPASAFRRWGITRARARWWARPRRTARAQGGRRHDHRPDSPPGGAHRRPRGVAALQTTVPAVSRPPVRVRGPCHTRGTQR